MGKQIRLWLRAMCLSLVLGSISVGLSAQEILVTGKVTNAAGETLIGANVVVKNTFEGGSTDMDGSFSITAQSSDTLLITYLSYSDMEVPIDGRAYLEIVMQEEAALMDEIVVIGYGVQRKSDLTGAISTIKKDDIKAIPSANAEQMLQGKVAGVQITPQSGDPGAGAIVRIRGTGTLNNASPLYVVDGMLLNDITFLNPNDIESIEVLKDASATAIYGSRGANGVIIVSTRKGSATDGARITFDAYYGVQQVIDRVDVVNASDYAQLTNELAQNTGGTPPFEMPDTFGIGTDWQDVIFQNAPIQSYSLSFSGGNDKVLYNVSGNYTNQEGVIRGAEFDRFTIRLNNSYKPKNYLEVGHNIAFNYIQKDDAAGVLNTALRTSPLTPVFNEDGTFGDASIYSSTANAEASIFYQYNKSNTYWGVGNVYLNLTFLKDFTFRTNLGLDISNSERKSFTPAFFVSSIQQNEISDLTVTNSQTRSWLWENTLTYNKEWSNHRINVLAGITSQEFNSEFLLGRAEDLIGDTPEFYYLNAGVEPVGGDANSNAASTWSLLSYLGRVNYTLLDRYLFTVSFRADGSSKFGANNRYGYFPSVAVGWNVTNEDFMQGQNLFDRLKLRASWGVIGNEKIDSEAAIPVVNPDLNNVVFGPDEKVLPSATITRLANPDLQWEETAQFNIGLEMGFLNNRLTAEIDYYNRETDKILVRVPIPNYVGSDQDPFINAATVVNQGWDFTVDWRDSYGDFSYSARFVGSTVQNEVTALGEGNEAIFGGGLGFGGILGTRTIIGGPIGSFYGYKVDGVFQNEQELETFPTRGTEGVGDLRFADIDGNGIIDENDRTDLGSPIPNFIWGFNLGAEYKGIDFSLDFNGQSGNKIINAKKMARFGNYNYEVSYLDRWNGEGTSDFEPRVTNSGHNYELSDRFIESGSFVRLRNIQIGYTFPKRLLDKIKLTNLRVYASGTNLLTWTDFTGYTPEVSSENVISAGIDNGVFPIAKVFTGGLSISF